MKLCQIVCRTGLLVACAMPALAAYAMEQLDDHQMAALTGQDGITLAIQPANSTLSFSQAGLVHIEDRTNALSPRASLVMAPTTFSPTQGIRFFASPTVATATAQPIRIDIDADGNNASPVLNINFALPTDLQRIQISPFSVYLANGNDSIFTPTGRPVNGTSILRTGVTEVFRVSGTGLNIVLAANNTVSANLQLGASEPQSSMLRFTGGAIVSISSDAPVELVSRNTSGVVSSLRFDLNIASALPAGFSLNGFYGDFNNAGLVFGKAGWSDPLNVTLNNVTVGTIPSPASTVFNSLPNASLGDIGLTGLRIRDLRLDVAGL